MIDITFLGTGTSQGVPMIGCSCSVCTSSDPKDKRTRSSILLKTAQENILVDTTPDLRTQCLTQNVTHVDSVLFTHSHTDHMMGFDDLRRFSELKGDRLPFYANEETLQKIRTAFAFVFDNPKPAKNYLQVDPQLITGPFQVGGLEITPVELPHGKMITLGFVFRAPGKKRPLLSYFTDCQDVPDTAIDEAFESQVVVLDALRDRFHPTHMNFEQAIVAAKKIEAEKTYFTHFCHDVFHAEKEKELPKSTFLAYDGLNLLIF